MGLHKTAFRFFGVFMVGFVTLLATWAIWGSAYGTLFRGAGDAMAFGSGSWTVKYLQKRDEDPNHDTQVLLLNPNKHLKRSVSLSSRRMAYMPTVFLLALIIATPIPRPRKPIAILWCFVGVHLYIASRLALVPATYITEPGAESEQTFLTTLNWVLSGSYAGWALVPLVIWLLVTLTYAWPLTLPETATCVSTGDPPTVALVKKEKRKVRRRTNRV